MDDFEATPEELARQQARKGNEAQARDDAIVEGRTVDLSSLPETGLPSGRCPHCGELTEDHVITAEELLSSGEDCDPPLRQYICCRDDCGREWGPLLAAAPAGAVVESGPKFQNLPKEGLTDDDGSARCPHCGVYTGRGRHVTEYSELSPGSQRDTIQQYTCNDCAGEWGPVVEKPKSQRRPSGTSSGLKIERDREQSNGVTRPSAGGKCRAVWDMLDAIGTGATAREARERAAALGLDKTTTMVQFYKWRKFNGLSGRQ